MTNRPVRIGVQLQPQHADYSQIRDAVTRIEELGVDVVFNWDHFFPLTGGRGGKHFECWTMLAAWAEQTSRIEIGALVTCNSYRNPDLLADMTRTVDHISGGRLILGIGSGWFQHDYDEYGYEFGTPGGRLDDLGRSLPLIRQRLGQLNPAPIREVPVLIGGGGEKKTLRLVAEHAHIWHTFAGGDELRHKLDVLQRHCDVVGRDIDDIEVSVYLGPDVEPDPSEAPETYGEQNWQLGARLFTISVNGPDYPLDVVSRWVAWRDEVNAR